MQYLKKTIRLVIPLVLIAAIIGGAFMLAKQKRQALSQAPKFAVGPVPVHVVEAHSKSFAQSHRYVAIVEPLQTAGVSSRVTAEIQSIACDEGDAVEAGDVMAELDSREIQAGIATAESQISQLREDLKAAQALVGSLAASVEYWQNELVRDQSLRTGNTAAISLAELEATAEKLQLKQGDLASAKHRVTSIEHGVEAAQDKKLERETMLAYCTIVSPFSGIVTSRIADPGDMAAPGKVLFLVENRSIVRLAFSIPQEDLSEIKPGLPVVFTAAGKSYSFPLSRVYPSSNADRMIRAEVDVPGDQAQGLTTGTYVPVSVELRVYTDVTVIPASSLVNSEDGSSTVFVIEQGQLVLLPVTPLAFQDNEVAVTGIEVGQQVVIHSFLGWARYYPGQKVEVIQ